MAGCDGCDGRCCKRYYVTLTHCDIGRIRDAGHDPIDFLSCVPVGDIESPHADIRLGGSYHYLTLKRDEGGRCLFARDEGGTIQCTIHGSHPMSCRIYPFDPLTGGARRRHICAKVDEGSPGLGGLYDDDLEERREYQGLAMAWNSKKVGRRDLASLLEHLLD